MISLSIVSCAKKKDKAFSESENIEVPNAPKTGDIIKTYSGTFHLKATLNEKESDCSLEAASEEEQIKKQKYFFEKIKTIKDSFNCEQANEAFQCQSTSYNELLFKGNIKKDAFELKLDKQRLSYVKDIDFGKNALITTILKGSFYSADLAREGKMVNVNQVMQKNIIRAGKKCSLAWDFDLYRDKNSATSKKPPVIKSIEFKPEAQKINAEIKVTDEDSAEKDIEIVAIYFLKDASPAEKDIDWTKATKISNGQYFIANPEDGKTYIVFVKAVDEGGNQAVLSKEYTFKKPAAVVGSDGATGGGGANPAVGGSGATGSNGVTDKPAATTITVVEDQSDILQEFVTDLCEANTESVSIQEPLKKLCSYTFTADAPKFYFQGAVGTMSWINVEATSLSIAGYKIKVLPESIEKLVSLKSIYIDPSDLVTLPATISKLKNLKELTLTHGKMNALPETIGELTSLEKLILNNNKLTTLPTSIEKLTQLKELDLQYNPIKPNEKIRLNKLFGSKVKIKNR